MISQRRPGWRSGLAAALVYPSRWPACRPCGRSRHDLASGPDWAVTQVPGGYQVTVDLDKTLPIVSDAPTLVVDGVPIGLATESADGMSLSVFTSDPAVVNADEASRPAGSAARPTSPKTSRSDRSRPSPRRRPRAPSSMRTPRRWASTPSPRRPTTSVTSPSRWPASAASAVSCRARSTCPTTGGARPTVILLHGRHTSCSHGTPTRFRWPCGANQIERPQLQGVRRHRPRAGHPRLRGRLDLRQRHQLQRRPALRRQRRPRPRPADPRHPLDAATMHRRTSPIYHDAAARTRTCTLARGAGTRPPADLGTARPLDQTHPGLAGRPLRPRPTSV